MPDRHVGRTGACAYSRAILCSNVGKLWRAHAERRASPVPGARRARRGVHTTEDRSEWLFWTCYAIYQRGTRARAITGVRFYSLEPSASVPILYLGATSFST